MRDLFSPYMSVHMYVCICLSRFRNVKSSTPNNLASILYIRCMQAKNKNSVCIQGYGRAEGLGLQHWAFSHRATGKAGEPVSFSSSHLSTCTCMITSGSRDYCGYIYTYQSRSQTLTCTRPKKGLVTFKGIIGLTGYVNCVQLSSAVVSFPCMHTRGVCQLRNESCYEILSLKKQTQAYT